MLTIEKPNATPSTALPDERAKQQPKLLDRMRESIRVKHYSLATERCYVGWARRFILFHGKRHPAEMGAPEVEAFLSALAIERNVSASTQNQAMHAILLTPGLSSAAYFACCQHGSQDWRPGVKADNKVSVRVKALASPHSRQSATDYRWHLRYRARCKHCLLLRIKTPAWRIR